MLKIYFGDMDDSIYNTNVYFDNTYEDEWITDDLIKKIIKDVDKSEVLDSDCIKSPVLGLIPPTELSGGTKTLILIEKDREQVFNASTCGDNCAKWILEIAKNKDITINLRHIMDFGEAEFEAEVVNNNSTVHNMRELLTLASKFLR